MNPLPEIPDDVARAAAKISAWMAEQGHTKWQMFDLCSRNHADALDRAEAKLARLSRLIDLAKKCDDAKSEAELAASATFMEALALTNADLLEKERDEARAEVEGLVDVTIRGMSQTISELRAEVERLKASEYQMALAKRVVRVHELTVERDAWRAAACGCDDALRNCMGHLSGEHPHWKAAFKAHGIVEKLTAETGKKA